MFTALPSELRTEYYVFFMRLRLMSAPLLRLSQVNARVDLSSEISAGDDLKKSID
jgi:hypothetical protein